MTSRRVGALEVSQYTHPYLPVSDTNHQADNPHNDYHEQNDRENNGRRNTESRKVKN
jgi:hypothetical protein